MTETQIESSNNSQQASAVRFALRTNLRTPSSREAKANLPVWDPRRSRSWWGGRYTVCFFYQPEPDGLFCAASRVMKPMCRLRLVDKSLM